MIVSGISESKAESIGQPLTGHGVLGSLDKSDALLRLANISSHPHSTGFPDYHPVMHAMIELLTTFVKQALDLDSLRKQETNNTPPHIYH
ncbi:MAG: hypothetical protein OSB68_09830 [Dehalococcoidia bacterium]|nr:hypothetical protein [Dehalococcoidia bacterium]